MKIIGDPTVAPKAPASSGANVPKQARDPNNLPGVTPQVGPFAPGTPPGGSNDAIYPQFSSPGGGGDPGGGGNDPTDTTSSGPQGDATGSNAVLTELTKGYTPNYSSLAQNDFGYQAALNAQSADQPILANARSGAIQNYLVQYGFNPGQIGSFSDPYGDVNSATLQAIANANQSGTSLSAQMAKSYQEGLQSLQNSLAARGIISSGQGNQAQSDANTTYNVNVSNAVNQLLGYLTQAQQGYLTGVQNDQNTVNSALSDAMNRVTQEYPTIAPTTATYNNSTGQYVDPYGNQYDGNGNLLH